MTGQLSISLAPSGAIRLHLPHHTVELPTTIAGLKVLQLILMEQEAGQVQIGQPGNPTQHTIDSWLTSPAGQRALQLAGETKRWRDTQQRTGVTTRRAQEPKPSKPRPAPAGLTLEELIS